MPIIDLEAEQKKALEAKKGRPSIETKQIGDTTYFKGVLLDDWFSDYGECIKANQEAAVQKRYKEMGLNEFGQTPEQEKRVKQIAVLVEKKNKVLKDLAEIDIEIATLKRSFVAEDNDDLDQSRLEKEKDRIANSKKKK